MKNCIAHNKCLSYCMTSVITQLAVLLLAPDYGKKSITFYNKILNIIDHEEKDLNQGKYEMLLSRGAMITFVLTPLIILSDKYINQTVITHSKPLQYFLISGESVLPF